MKSKCPTCHTKVRVSEIVFDNEFVVVIEDETAFNKIVAKVGEDWFRFPTSNDLAVLDSIDQAKFLEYLTTQTDLIVEH